MGNKENGQLVNYTAARRALIACVKVDEAKAIRDKAAALEAYARQSQDHEMETWAAEIRVRAMRRIGEISKDLAAAKPAGGRGKVVLPTSGRTKAETLADAGLTVQEANRCEHLAAIPARKFERLVEERKAEGRAVSARELVSKVKAGIRRQQTDERLQSAKDSAGAVWKMTDDQSVVACHALITDPPYGILDEPWEPQELESFTTEWLARWRECGADMLAIFWSQEHLWKGREWFDDSLSGYSFQQLLVWHYANNKSPQSRDGFKQTWEPIFLYRKDGCDRKVAPGSGDLGAGLNDFDCHVAAVPQSNFRDADEKRHPAQKPLSVMRWLVNALTIPGECVADPFAGSGTTGIAARQLHRSFHGIEMDAAFLKLAKQRIRAYGTAAV